ncbi:unnamed protein product [Bathycoccus prasinos]|mmetsp:Transcript_6899/g.22869  ORF Transcript_6899/g.22869 Transcript_6899/m.22869 type:complete len:306 (+) Transcript_6899:211-1128(+)
MEETTYVDVDFVVANEEQGRLNEHPSSSDTNTDTYEELKEVLEERLTHALENEWQFKWLRWRSKIMSDTQALSIGFSYRILGTWFLLRAFFDLNCIEHLFLSIFCVYLYIYLFTILLGSESVAKKVVEMRILVQAVGEVRRKSRKPFAEFCKSQFDAHANDEEVLHSYEEMYKEVAKTSFRMLKEKISNGYTFKFIRWRQQLIKDITLTKIIKWSIVSFRLAMFGYFTYLLFNGKDSDDHKAHSILAFYFFQFLCLFFKSENLARFLREREIMNSVWTEKVTTNRIEEERKDFDEFGAFVRNERL